MRKISSCIPSQNGNGSQRKSLLKVTPGKSHSALFNQSHFQK